MVLSLTSEMINEDQNNPNDQNVKSTQEKYTPQRVIVNAAEFNRKFNDFEIGGDRATVRWERC